MLALNSNLTTQQVDIKVKHSKCLPCESARGVPRQHVIAALAVGNVQDLLSRCLEQQHMSNCPTWKFLLAEAENETGWKVTSDQQICGSHRRVLLQ